MTNYNAHETFYKGILFRSTLEAKWAYFFDFIKLEWIYEPTVFEGLFGEKYLPDFYFPNLNKYAEVKPSLQRLYDCGGKISACIDFNATELSDTGLIILGAIPYYRNSFQIPVFPFLYWHKGIVLGEAHFMVNYAISPRIHDSERWYDATSAPDFPRVGTTWNDKLYLLRDYKLGDKNQMLAFVETNKLKYDPVSQSLK